MGSRYSSASIASSTPCERPSSANPVTVFLRGSVSPRRAGRIGRERRSSSRGLRRGARRTFPCSKGSTRRGYPLGRANPARHRSAQELRRPRRLRRRVLPAAAGRAPGPDRPQRRGQDDAPAHDRRRDRRRRRRASASPRATASPCTTSGRRLQARHHPRLATSARAWPTCTPPRTGCAELERRMAAGDGSSDDVLRAYAHAQSELESVGGYAWRARFEEILRGLELQGRGRRPAARLVLGRRADARVARARARRRSPTCCCSTSPRTTSTCARSSGSRIELTALDLLDPARLARPLVPRARRDRRARARVRARQALRDGLQRLPPREGDGAREPGRRVRAPAGRDRAPAALRRQVPRGHALAPGAVARSSRSERMRARRGAAPRRARSRSASRRSSARAAS